MAKRVCALEGCEEKFTPKRRDQKYHSPACTTLAYNRSRQRSKGAPPDDLDVTVRQAAQRDTERRNQAELRKLVAVEQRQRRLEMALTSAVKAHEPTKLVRPPGPGRHLPVHEDILVTSDWHVGLQVTQQETGGIYEQDVATTRQQVAKIWRAVEHLHQIDSTGRRVRKLHHLFLGDLAEGSGMRPSQARKVEDVMTVQTVQGFDLLAWLIRQELQLYPEVEVDLVGGNHDRLSPKAGDAGLGELSYVDNITWLAGAFLERVLAKDIDDGRLKIRNWTTFFGFKEIMGLKVVFEHGSSFKWAAGGYGGVPWYSVSQLAPRYATMLGGADLIVIGHGHRPVVMPNNRSWLVANGALPATSTYVQAGQKVVSRPQQWRLSTHEEYGITNFTPIYCDVPGMLLPGAIWEDPKHYADLASGKAAWDATKSG